MDAKNKAKMAEEFLHCLNTEGELTRCDIGSPTSIQLSLPEWFDEKKFKRGQKFYRDNLYSAIICQFFGVLTIIGTCYKMLRILDFTGNSSTLSKTYIRAVSTFLYALSLYDDDFKVNSKSWREFQTIRRNHHAYSEKTDKKGLGFFSQKDMADTMFSIMGYIMTRPEYLGIHNASKEDLEAMIHVNRTVGYILGTEDRFNLIRDTLQDTEEVCIAYLRHVRNIYSLDYPLAQKATNATLDIAKILNIFLNREAALYYTRFLIGLKGYQCMPLHADFIALLLRSDRCQRTSCHSDTCVFNKLVWTTRLYIIFMVVLFKYLLQFYVVKVLFNVGVRILELSVKYFPLAAILKFGRKNAYTKV